MVQGRNTIRRTTVRSDCVPVEFLAASVLCHRRPHPFGIPLQYHEDSKRGRYLDHERRREIRHPCAFPRRRDHPAPYLRRVPPFPVLYTCRSVRGSKGSHREHAVPGRSHPPPRPTGSQDAYPPHSQDLWIRRGCGIRRLDGDVSSREPGADGGRRNWTRDRACTWDVVRVGAERGDDGQPARGGRCCVRGR